ncbi:MAG: DNA polymerase III subunit alpha [Rhodospirillaceae bacterium]|nr:DNA polymerase III subunit alpha [Rhodospirillaceae bacterium]
MPHGNFVHLRTHSAYSLSEGAIKISNLIELALQNNMPAIGLTDKGNLFGAMEFSEKAKESGLQPILGLELAITDKNKGSLVPSKKEENLKPNWIVLLTQSEIGWQNLMALSSKAYLDTPPTEVPQVNFEKLSCHSDGLIALSGGPDGPIGQLIQKNKIKEAYNITESLSKIFKDRFYIEIMRHDRQSEIITEPHFIKISQELKLPIVATNDIYFSDTQMHEAHDVLMCISQGAHIDQPNRNRVTPQHYFRSTEEMEKLFSDIPEAIENTLTIAKRTAYATPLRDPILPKFEVSHGRTESQELKYQAQKGLESRFSESFFCKQSKDKGNENIKKIYVERLNSELKIISDMNFPGYFLIVADFIRWAKENKIPVGPGRGSGAGSLVAWALTITDIDPIRFGLLFERFLNPERISMPDFDIDFCRNRRDEVIDYVCQRYGQEKVAQIITFGKLEARAVIRDVGRVLGLPYGQVDKISKLVPFNPANPIRLEEAIREEPLFQQMKDEDPSVARLLKIALKLEGLYRHASTHAAGLVIGDRPLNELVPLYRDPRSSMPVTQFSMYFSENSGLVKFDFLGLKTLTVIDNACRLIEIDGEIINLSNIPLDDQLTFQLLASGHTAGVFQLESTGMRDALRGLRPDKFEDIIAIVALYRPGPMENIPQYVARKHGTEKPDYLHKMLEGILRETYGVIIYQEQVMEIARVLSGYSLGSADILRRAMGKKIQSEMDDQREIFVNGAINNGVEKTQASQIFDLVARFAGYGFNKSHAAAYALVAYQTAYLKANYPVQFMAATMTLDLNNTDKLSGFKQELDRLGVTLLPPNINYSNSTFSVEKISNGKNAVRYALSAIKNVGEQAMEILVEERKKNGLFSDMFSLVARVGSHALNKRQLENLTKAGAFDDLNKNRKQIFESIEILVRYAESARRDINQASLFDNAKSGTIEKLTLPTQTDWSISNKLQFEQDSLGYFLSAHPLDNFEKKLEKLGVIQYASLQQDKTNLTTVRLSGVILNIQERSNADGKFAFVRFSDPSGSFEIAFFRDIYTLYKEQLKIGEKYLIKTNVRREEDQFRLTAEKIEKLNSIMALQKNKFELHINSNQSIIKLHEILKRQCVGDTTILLIIHLENQIIEISIPQKYSITPDIISEIDNLEGIIKVIEC